MIHCAELFGWSHQGLVAVEFTHCSAPINFHHALRVLPPHPRTQNRWSAPGRRRSETKCNEMFYKRRDRKRKSSAHREIICALIKNYSHANHRKTSNPNGSLKRKHESEWNLQDGSPANFMIRKPRRRVCVSAGSNLLSRAACTRLKTINRTYLKCVAQLISKPRVCTRCCCRQDEKLLLFVYSGFFLFSLFSIQKRFALVFNGTENGKVSPTRGRVGAGEKHVEIHF